LFKNLSKKSNNGFFSFFTSNSNFRPLLNIYKQIENREYVLVYTSDDIIVNNHEKIYIKIENLCSNDYDRLLKFEIVHREFDGDIIPQ